MNSETGRNNGGHAAGHEKQLTIAVNGQEKTVTGKEISFVQVVELAFPGSSADSNATYTVTYRRAEGNKPAGTMVEGDTVKLKDGTTFDVTRTIKS